MSEVPPGATWWWHWDLGRKPQWQTCPQWLWDVPGERDCVAGNRHQEQDWGVISFSVAAHEISALTFILQRFSHHSWGKIPEKSNREEWLLLQRMTLREPPCQMCDKVRNSWIKTQNILSINPWLPKRSLINVMSLAKWFLDSSHLHLITRVILQESTAAVHFVHFVTTVMPVLNQQTETDVKVGTPEKNFANVKTV